VTLARSIRQPGPPATERILAVPCGTLPIDVMLPAGVRLLDALWTTLDGAESACLTLSGGAFGPFAYVIPSLPPDPTHAAFYSDTFRPPGASHIDAAAVTLGLRDGQPFFHCHALWTEADGRQGCGHVLPDETMIHTPIHARGVAMFGARFEVQPDPETGFSLFTPKTTGTQPPSNTQPGVALRLAPNQDLTAALETVARAAGFAHAAVQGGVASLIGARFADAPPVAGYATEMLIRRGTVSPTELDIAIVDLHGTIGTGRLIAGDNPVLMTFEGLLTKEPTP
jgi:predicted DNA-binding protein with PD1-like motif